MQHSRLRALAMGVVLTSVFSLTGCDQLTDLVEGELDPDLIGEWIGISGLLVNTADATQQLDVITDLGAFLAITFHEDGTAGLVECDPFEGCSEDAATWSTSGDELTLHWQGDDEPETVTYSFNSAGHVVVDVSEDEAVDFDGDGTDETASLTFTFASADGTPDPDLVAQWSATSFVFTSQENPDSSVDVIQEGATFSIEFDGSSGYAMELTYPDGQGGTITENESGNFVALEGLLWVTESGDDSPDLVFYSISGGTATVTFEDVFDFDDDGVEEPADVEITLSSQ